MQTQLTALAVKKRNEKKNSNINWNIACYTQIDTNWVSNLNRLNLYVRSSSLDFIIIMVEM